MKKTAIAFAVILSAFSLVSISSYAAFLSMPTSSALSAYRLCNTSGAFGFSYTVLPPADACVVTQSGASAPDPAGAGAGHAMAIGYAKTRSIQVNNIYTGGVTKTIGSLQDWVWKDAASTSCIYGTKISLTVGADYQPAQAGVQHFEVNDVARGGFQGKTAQVAYSYPGSPSEVIYRIGQTYTSVQYIAAPGYVTLPATGLGFQPSINGSITAIPTSLQQLADYDDNWIDFTTNVNARHRDGSTTAASSWMFVKADGCPALNANGLPIDTPDAIRLRQTSKGVNGFSQFFIEIALPGFAPAGATLPAHTNPY